MISPKLQSLTISSLLMVSGCSFVNEKQPELVERDNSLVSDTPIFAKGKYYKTQDGYYISDLSNSPSNEIPGCSDPLLTSDLSKPNEGGQRQVQPVELNCDHPEVSGEYHD